MYILRVVPAYYVLFDLVSLHRASPTLLTESLTDLTHRLRQVDPSGPQPLDEQPLGSGLRLTPSGGLLRPRTLARRIPLAVWQRRLPTAQSTQFP